jgi:hypothetical protein
MAGPARGFYAGAAFAGFEALLMAYDSASGADPGHPYFADDAPCTMLIEEVEALWAPIAAQDDWTAFYAKLHAIGRMANAHGTKLAAPTP